MTQRSETILGFDRSNKISLFLQITRAFEKNFTLVLCSDSQLREFPMEKRNRIAIVSFHSRIKKRWYRFHVTIAKCRALSKMVDESPAFSRSRSQFNQGRVLVNQDDYTSDRTFFSSEVNWNVFVRDYPFRHFSPEWH